MTTKPQTLVSILSCFIILLSCAGNTDEDIINETYPEAQTQIAEAIQAIIRDASTANIQGLKDIHLKSDKFTKFGPRSFERVDLAGTNAEEEAFFSSISDYKQEVKDLKVDVFGEVAVATYHPQVSFVKNGEQKAVSGRQTFVFVHTKDGWKLVHEHGTVKTE